MRTMGLRVVSIMNSCIGENLLALNRLVVCVLVTATHCDIGIVWDYTNVTKLLVESIGRIDGWRS